MRQLAAIMFSDILGPIAILINHPMFKKMGDDPRYLLLREKLNLVG